VGTDAIPPHAGGLSARLVLGPALRAQSDRRLVRLVREGYEGAFEEIVRRYRRPLGRFAASIVGGPHEDVTQDSFRKALEALRRGDGEIELRPWLYRIVRNTALNELRDRPPAAAELAEELVAGTRSAAAEAESREEVAELIEHLRALPENQRAALLMRELDGMGHEEIAATLGISKGAARQAIARGRAAVRSGFGALLPMPLLRSLLEGGGPLEPGLGAGAASGAAATAIGAGGAGALKIGIATVVVAGGLGAGVALDHHPGGHESLPPAPTHSAPGASAHAGAFALGGNHHGELRTHDGGSVRDVADDSAPDGRSTGRRRQDGDDRHGDAGRGRGRGHGEDERGGPAIAATQSIDDEDQGRGGSTGAERGESHSGPERGGDSGAGGPSSADRDGHGGSGSGRGSGNDGSGSGGRGSASGDHGGSSSGDDAGDGSHSGGGSGDGVSGSVEGSGGTPPAESSSDGSGSSSSSGGPGPSSESGSSSGDDDPAATTSSSAPSPAEPALVVEDSSTSDGGGSSGGPGPSGDSEIHP
jgi:RNA polymerase sigma factor (sigma-70 family)